MNSTTSRIDLSTLSTHFRVLPTIPAWSRVEKALKHLRSSGLASTGDDPEIREYPEWLRQFAGMLTNNGVTLGEVLICAAAVGHVAGISEPGEQIWKGLSTISRLYRFDRLADDGVALRVKELKGTITALLPKPRDESGEVDGAAEAEGKPYPLRRADEAAQGGIPEVDGRGRKAKSRAKSKTVTDLHVPAFYDSYGIAHWKAAVRTAMATVRKQLPYGPDEVLSLREKAWTEWENRWPFYLRGEPFEALWCDVVTAAADVLPGATFTPVPGDMRLVDLSDALVHALADEDVSADRYLPAWMTWPILYSLQFKSVDRGRLAEWCNTDRGWNKRSKSEGATIQDPPSLERLPRSARARPGLLVIKQPFDSVVDSWKPNEWAPALGVTSSELLRLSGGPRAIKTLLHILGITTIAWEAPLPTADQEWVREIAHSTPATLVHIYNKPEQDLLQPFVLNPSGPRDVTRSQLGSRFPPSAG